MNSSNDMIRVKSMNIGAGKYSVSDIEMVNFEGSPPYTSLKDIVESSSPTSWMIASPNKQSSGNGGGSWREIPIKNPLVQHAAWAYLLPMNDGAGGDHSRNFMLKLKERCCGVFGCLNGIILLIVRNWRLQAVDRYAKSQL